MKNYYHILGLSFESNPEKELIDAAFKALVKIYHPDVFKGDKKSRDREITEINEAYETLNDSEKKKKYDERLSNFHNKNFFDYSDEDFEDKDVFDKKYIDEDWEIALLVYPELEDKKKIMSKYSLRLSLQFQFYLLETKEFFKFNIIANRFIEAFLERKFGTSTRIKLLSKILIENDFRKNAIYLNKLIKVIGIKSEQRIIKTFFKQYPDIEKFASEEIKFHKKINLNELPNTNNQYFFAIILVVLLILLFFAIINN